MWSKKSNISNRKKVKIPGANKQILFPVHLFLICYCRNNGEKTKGKKISQPVKLKLPKDGKHTNLNSKKKLFHSLILIV